MKPKPKTRTARSRTKEPTYQADIPAGLAEELAGLTPEQLTARAEATAARTGMPVSLVLGILNEVRGQVTDNTKPAKPVAPG